MRPRRLWPTVWTLRGAWRGGGPRSGAWRPGAERERASGWFGGAALVHARHRAGRVERIGVSTLRRELRSMTRRQLRIERRFVPGRRARDTKGSPARGTQPVLRASRPRGGSTPGTLRLLHAPARPGSPPRGHSAISRAGWSPRAGSLWFPTRPDAPDALPERRAHVYRGPQSGQRSFLRVVTQEWRRAIEAAGGRLVHHSVLALEGGHRERLRPAALDDRRVVSTVLERKVSLATGHHLPLTLTHRRRAGEEPAGRESAPRRMLEPEPERDFTRSNQVAAPIAAADLEQQLRSSPAEREQTLDLNVVTEEVIRKLDRRTRVERERRGI